ncbi:MAG: type I restriction endonuclease subunit S [Proteobacteria bacterium]|nr:type I restriction endonuclease subunit S [Pseudomonadota bacterium]
MAGINVTKLKNIIVHVPPIALQNQFAEFVQLADKSKLVIQETLEKHAAMKAAIMRTYFN